MLAAGPPALGAPLPALVIHDTLIHDTPGSAVVGSTAGGLSGGGIDKEMLREERVLGMGAQRQLSGEVSSLPTLVIQQCCKRALSLSLYT